jgi:hypothetical protein
VLPDFDRCVVHTAQQLEDACCMPWLCTGAQGEAGCGESRAADIRSTCRFGNSGETRRVWDRMCALCASACEVRRGEMGS